MTTIHPVGEQVATPQPLVVYTSVKVTVKEKGLQFCFEVSIFHGFCKPAGQDTPWSSITGETRMYLVKTQAATLRIPSQIDCQEEDREILEVLIINISECIIHYPFHLSTLMR
jgi:hypothetical protein